MSERPNAVLALLLAAASLFAGLLLWGLFALGGQGFANISATIAHALSACIFFLVELGHVPLTSLAAVVLAAASLIAFARTVRAYLVQARLLRSLPLEPLPDRNLALRSREAGVDVYVTPATRPAAFCFGLVRPRVVVTGGLLARLNPEERAAAVCHEVHHARSHEPLKCLVARLAASTLFWLPILSDLLDRYLLVKELAADRLAVRRTSERALAGALHEVAGTPTPVAAVGLAEFAAARIDRLFDPNAGLPPLWRRSRLAFSIFATIGVSVIAAAPGRLAIAPPQSMLLGATPHGLAGTCLGFAFNTLVLVALTLVAWQLIAQGRRAGGKS